jgi:hypothetical protein
MLRTKAVAGSTVDLQHRRKCLAVFVASHMGKMKLVYWVLNIFGLPKRDIGNIPAPVTEERVVRHARRNAHGCITHMN